MLAHITPREAKILTDKGGSGTKNPKTGLWEFDDSGSFGGDFSYQPVDSYQAPSSYSSTPATDQLTGYNPPSYTPPAQTDYSQGFNVSDVPTTSGGGTGFTPASTQYGMSVAPAGTQAENVFASSTAPNSAGSITSAPVTPTNPGLTVQDQNSFTGTPASDAQKEKYPSPEKPGILSSLTSGDTLAKLGLAAGIGGLGVVKGNAANKQAAQQQTQQAALGKPYQDMGQALVQGANQGQLTPAGQQALAAAQAQAQQGAASRGGVGVAQIANQLASLKAQLLQQQLDYGIKLSGIGDQIVAGSLQAGWQADQQAQQLQGNYFDAAFKILGALK